VRLHPSLAFNAECDAQLYDNVYPALPDNTGLASCKNLFLPCPAAGDRLLKPADGECVNKTFWEWLTWMD